MELFDAGAAYDAVLEHNYMFHREIYEDVAHLLSHRQEPFTILDLGCGTARYMAQTLRNCTVTAYDGFDLSESALREARNNLAHLNCPVTLHHGDMLGGLTATTHKREVIFSGFAQHHLSWENKAAFFEHAHRVLHDDGMLLLVDAAREPDEDRDTFLDAYYRRIKTEWKALTPEAQDEVCCHMREYDFPETALDIHALAARAGFAGRREVNQFHRHHTWSFTKTP
jgi:cyclopropane fatty-acyl-phospholipid synthase-like methyltransferase